MRRCIQVVVVALLLGVSPAAAERGVLREQSEQTVEPRGFKSLEVVNSRGRVDLLPSPDARLHVTALKIVRVGNTERAEAVARGIVVETGIQGDRYVVEVRYQKRRNIRVNFWDFFRVDGMHLTRYEVRIACQVPRGMPVTVRESSGDIRSEGLATAQVLKTSSGDIEVLSAGGPLEASSSSGDVTATGIREAKLKSVSGDVVVRLAAGPLRASSSSGGISVADAGGELSISTVSGDIQVRQVAGALRASTSSGGISVTGARDSLSLSSVSGDIEADAAPRGLEAGSSSGAVVVRGVTGTVKVGTVSGDVRLSLREPLRGVEAGTTSGEIRLALDSAVGCSLDMQTSSGTIEVEQPMQMKNVSRRSVTGVIRGGRTPVVLHTTSGDITVVGAGG